MNIRNFLKVLLASPIAAFASNIAVLGADNVDKGKPSQKEKTSSLLTPTEIAMHWEYVRTDVVELNGKVYSCVMRRIPVAISTDLFDVKTSKWTGNTMLILTAKACIIDAVNKLGFTHIQSIKGILYSDQANAEPRLSVYAFGLFKKS